MNNEKKEQTIADRQKVLKENVLNALHEGHTVTDACKKADISTTTYYRWIQEDFEFEKAAKSAIQEGKQIMNDLAKSKLKSLIEEGYFPAIAFQLRYHHPDYMEKTRKELEEMNTEVLEHKKTISLLHTRIDMEIERNSMRIVYPPAKVDKVAVDLYISSHPKDLVELAKKFGYQKIIRPPKTLDQLKKEFSFYHALPAPSEEALRRLKEKREGIGVKKVFTQMMIKGRES